MQSHLRDGDSVESSRNTIRSKESNQCVVAMDSYIRQLDLVLLSFLLSFLLICCEGCNTLKGALHLYLIKTSLLTNRVLVIFFKWKLQQCTREATKPWQSILHKINDNTSRVHIVLKKEREVGL